jgi:putative ABC transport system substrate-binding protein
MVKYGYIEGKNTTYIKCESKDGKVIETAIGEMMDRKVDMIFAMTTPMTLKVKQITKNAHIPIVFVAYDAVRSGVVESLVRPGGNLTGVQLTGSTPKSLELLSAIAPRTKRIFVPVCSKNCAVHQSLADLKQGAAKLGLDLLVSGVDTVDELKAVLSSMPGDIDAIFIAHCWLVGSNMDIVSAAAMKRKIPVFSAGQVHAEDGALIAYGPKLENTGAQAARLAHHVLQGTPAANLPVETSDLCLEINLRVAKAIGLEVPEHVLQQAGIIIR